MCYIFMCIERYLLALYPDRDWTLVAKKMWQWPAASCWHDDEWDAYISIMPELVMTGYRTEGYGTVQDYIDASFPESPARNMSRPSSCTRDSRTETLRTRYAVFSTFPA